MSAGSQASGRQTPKLRALSFASSFSSGVAFGFAAVFSASLRAMLKEHCFPGSSRPSTQAFVSPKSLIKPPPMERRPDFPRPLASRSLREGQKLQMIQKPISIKPFLPAGKASPLTPESAELPLANAIRDGLQSSAAISVREAAFRVAS